MPLRIVKVSVPSLTTPAALVTVALSVHFADVLKVTEALAAAVAVAAALTVRSGWCRCSRRSWLVPL